MNNQELNRVLGKLDAMFKDFTFPVPSKQHEWYDAFKKDALVAVEKAIDDYAAENENAPSIEKIKAYMKGVRFNRKKFEDLRKWTWEVQEVEEVLPVSGEIHKKKKPVKRLMKYKINRWGDIVDELGRIYADPDENVQQQLVNKVKQTGRLI